MILLYEFHFKVNDYQVNDIDRVLTGDGTKINDRKAIKDE